MPLTRTNNHPQARADSSTNFLAPSPESTTRSTSAKRKRDTTSRPKPVILGNVIEISSDDDEPAPQINSALVDLRRRAKKLKEVGALFLFAKAGRVNHKRTKETSRLKSELISCKNELSCAKKEISELKAPSSGPGKGKLTLVRVP
ncbi:hypothetical protein H0H87_004198 [Tephrocybe sp. NHM501043]|nr:hypothetical protein H0H87_004198 [Tephrocybe sp. NHM501043]